MALSASQVRLLQLTRTSNDIKCRLTQLSLDKMSLARDMDKVSRKYQAALNTKTLKWTNNGGADYVDMSYANLMYPGAANGWSLYMLTDMNGRVVVDNKYKQYAEIISPDGSPGGDWESHKGDILPQVVGIGAAQYAQGLQHQQDFEKWKAEVEKLEEEKPQPTDSKYSFITNSTGGLLKKLDNFKGINWEKSATDGTTISRSDAEEIIEKIKNELVQYFPNQTEAFNKACDATLGPDNTEEYTVKQLVALFMGALKTQDPTLIHLANHGNSEEITWYDVEHPSYEKYKDDLDDWETKHDAAVTARDEANVNMNAVFSPDVKKQMEFYDALFSSIAEKGWKYYSEVSSGNYVDQMLQNGLFSITSVQRDAEEGENTYVTDIAANCSHVVQVSDSSVRDSALVEYEHEKRIINAKETKIDTRMKILETEQDAIKQMMESIEKVKENNIESTFNLWG